MYFQTFSLLNQMYKECGYGVGIDIRAHINSMRPQSLQTHKASIK